MIWLVPGEFFKDDNPLGMQVRKRGRTDSEESRLRHILLILRTSHAFRAVFAGVLSCIVWQDYATLQNED